MTRLKMTIPHQLAREEATGRIKRLLSETAARFQDKISDLHESWEGSKGTFRFRAAGFAVSGTLEVNDVNVEIDGSLPFAAVLFKGTIESRINEEATRLLS